MAFLLGLDPPIRSHLVTGRIEGYQGKEGARRQGKLFGLAEGVVRSLSEREAR